MCVNRKQCVGTFHSKAAPKAERVEYDNRVLQNSNDWKCKKCQTMNMKSAPYCTKCRGMKRLGQ